MRGACRHGPTKTVGVLKPGHRRPCGEALDRTISIAQEEKAELYVEIGQTMRKYRTDAGVSLREMARRLKCSAPLLSDMERGNRYYSVKWRIKAFAALYTMIQPIFQTYSKIHL